MTYQTVEKLIELGWEKDWLEDVNSTFFPKKIGKYEMKIYDIEDLSDEPEDGTYVDTACIDDERDLSVIHHFYEGFAYVMTIKSTGKEIGRGIIDGAPFDEIGEEEGATWYWIGPEDLGAIYKEQRDRWLAKLIHNN